MKELNFNIIVGKNIRIARIQTNTTIQQLSLKTGIDKKTLTDIELGNIRIHFSYYIIIMGSLNIGFEELLEGTNHL